MDGSTATRNGSRNNNVIGPPPMWQKECFSFIKKKKKKNNECFSQLVNCRRDFKGIQLLCNFVLHPCYKHSNPSLIDRNFAQKKKRKKEKKKSLGAYVLFLGSWDCPFHLPRESHISLQRIVHAKRIKKKTFYFTKKKITLIIYFTFLCNYFYNKLYITFILYYNTSK